MNEHIFETTLPFFNVTLTLSGDATLSIVAAALAEMSAADLLIDRSNLATLSKKTFAVSIHTCAASLLPLFSFNKNITPLPAASNEQNRDASRHKSLII
jgi:hypothetical protein